MIIDYEAQRKARKVSTRTLLRMLSGRDRLYLFGIWIGLLLLGLCADWLLLRTFSGVSILLLWQGLGRGIATIVSSLLAVCCLRGRPWNPSAPRVAWRLGAITLLYTNIALCGYPLLMSGVLLVPPLELGLAIWCLYLVALRVAVTGDWPTAAIAAVAAAIGLYVTMFPLGIVVWLMQ